MRSIHLTFQKIGFLSVDFDSFNKEDRWRKIKIERMSSSQFQSKDDFIKWIREKEFSDARVALNLAWALAHLRTAPFYTLEDGIQWLTFESADVLRCCEFVRIILPNKAIDLSAKNDLHCKENSSTEGALNE